MGLSHVAVYSDTGLVRGRAGMAQLLLRRDKAGQIHVLSEVPDSHFFSAQWIQDRIKDGSLKVTVELATADDPVVWNLAGLEGEDGDTNLTSWHVVTSDG